VVKIAFLHSALPPQPMLFFSRQKDRMEEAKHFLFVLVASIINHISLASALHVQWQSGSQELSRFVSYYRTPIITLL